MPEPLLQLEGVTKTFPVPRPVWTRFGKPQERVHAVVDVSLEVRRGETLGLVGESGSGKTTLARLIVRLLEPEKGRIRFESRDVTHIRGFELRRARIGLQMIFQDPYASLNPRLRVGDAISEPLRVHRIVPPNDTAAETARLLEQVGLLPRHAGRYPFELSGGQRQRVGIARALAVRPLILVADEAVSALDVSIQAQVLNLLADLRDQLGLTLVLISHDLGVVEYLSDRIGVMYLGRLVEVGGAVGVFRRPAHPYTQGLVRAIPVPDPRVRTQAAAVQGELPSPVHPPTGCVFRTRCPIAQPICETEPPLIRVGDAHVAACHFATPAPA